MLPCQALSGFFGEDRPEINRLLDLIAQDHNGRIPVYAEADFAEVETRRHAEIASREDPAIVLLKRIVETWRMVDSGKRKALRPLLREAERMVA